VSGTVQCSPIDFDGTGKVRACHGCVIFVIFVCDQDMCHACGCHGHGFMNNRYSSLMARIRDDVADMVRKCRGDVERDLDRMLDSWNPDDDDELHSAQTPSGIQLNNV
jgi:hypothetical protein